MNLHEQMRQDLEDVFFDLDEFAELHEINGIKLACIVDATDGQFQTGTADGFSNVSGIGVLQGSRTVYCKGADLVLLPLPGQKITMDGDYWLVSDNISETEGMITMHLTRAY